MGKYDQFLVGLSSAPTSSSVLPGKGKYDQFLVGLDQSATSTVNPQERTQGSPIVGALKRIYDTNPIEAEKAFRGFIATPEGRQKIAPYLPAAGSVAGSVLAPGIGTALGGGVGDILRQLVAVEGGARPTPLRAGLEAAGATALSGIPETSTVVNALRGAAQGAGRRALGFTKRFISKTPRQLAEANRTAQAMLDEGVIRSFSGTESTLKRALAAGQQSGKVIGKTIDDLESSGQAAVRPSEIVSEIEAQLGPRFGGDKKFIFEETKGSKVPLFKEVTTPKGAYGKTRGIVEEAKDTVKAHGGVGYASPEEIGFRSTQKLKEKLANIGRFVPGTVDERQQVFQRATGIVRKAQDQAVSRAARPEVAAKYKAAKKVYGETERAIGGLTNRLSSEKGNLQLGLLDTVLAAGNLASGNLAGAAATIGIKKALDRAGSGTISSIANALAKSGLKRSAANSVFQTIIAQIESE